MVLLWNLKPSPRDVGLQLLVPYLRLYEGGFVDDCRVYSKPNPKKIEK